MITTAPIGVQKETYYEDVCKYPFNAISALFGAYVDVDRVRVWDFTKRSFCWVEICYPYSFSFINEHILKIHCLNGGQHYLFIDLKNSCKLKTGDIFVRHNSQFLLEETPETLTVRPLSDLSKVQRKFKNPEWKLNKRIVESRIFGTRDREVYELTEKGLEYVTSFPSRLVFDTENMLFMSDGVYDSKQCLDAIPSNPNLKALFADDYPYVHGAVRGIHSCYNANTGEEIPTDMSPFLTRIQNGRLLLAGCGRVKTIDLKTHAVTQGYFHLSIPSYNGDTYHFILLEDRNWRYLYDIDKGKIIHEYTADVKAS